MNQFNDEEIGKLLRLKRHEQPAPEYFENFLHEFHRRQRAELLRQPLWKIALQRAQDFMLQLNVPALTSYPAAATAILILAAVLSLKVSQAPHTSNTVATGAIVRPIVSEVSEPTLSLRQRVSTRDSALTPFRMATENVRAHGRGTTPRYVLDSTPVSYDVALRF